MQGVLQARGRQGGIDAAQLPVDPGLRALRAAMPNTRLQMLLRGQNLVGYRHYADDVLERFIERSATNGIDVFRIFDALNWVPNMRVAIDAVRKQGKVAEVALCYTGDVLGAFQQIGEIVILLTAAAK